MAKKNKRGTGLLLVCASQLLMSDVYSLEFDIGGVNVDIDSTLTYSAIRRMHEADQQFLNDPSNTSEIFAVYGRGPQQALDHTVEMQRDDGNRNFSKGLVSSRYSFLSSMDINYGRFGLFTRVTGLYDSVYKDRQTDNNSLITYNTGALNANNREFPDETSDQHGADLELLDGFVYGEFTLADKNLSLRVGKQAVSWGEALRIPNGINFANGPVDASKLTVPGIELNEVFRPVGAIYAQFEISDTMTLETYYQYEWEDTRIPGVGSYFSEIDLLNKGGDNVLVPASFVAFNGNLAQGADINTAATAAAGITAMTQMMAVSPFVTIDRADDRTASDDGQFGVALRWLVESLNESEFGFYFMRYHEKTPSPVFRLGAYSPFASDGSCILPGGVGCPPGPVPDAAVPGNDTFNWIDPLQAAIGRGVLPPSAALGGMVINAYDNSEYFLDYVEDVELYGFSVGTVVGDVTLAGEVSLREGVPVAIAEEPIALIAQGVAAQDLPGTEYLTYTLEDVFHWDFSAMQIFGPNFISDSAIVLFEVAGDQVKNRKSHEVGNTLVPVTASSWGYTMAVDLVYNDVVPGLKLTVPFVYSEGVHGDSPFAAGMKDDRRQASVGVIGQFYENFVAELRYTAYSGDDERNTIADRDFLSFAVKYSF
jgi:Protein of unknown function (DUF1302)